MIAAFSHTLCPFLRYLAIRVECCYVELNIYPCLPVQAARHKAGILCDSVQSISGENDLKLCITSYFKGASGKYSQKSGQAPLYIDDERELENKLAKLQKGKRAIQLDSTDDHVEVVCSKEGKSYE
ncbi:unnamed protein product [Coffea canephora]|uniref:DH200=94 genomic scaffold, scaffold_2983 n=1 Tax=Coffea canephora TaxID=49390 RepID=A0A068VKX8_COFCA|nr:unnamed protein product [Coffea canephora]